MLRIKTMLCAAILSAPLLAAAPTLSADPLTEARAALDANLPGTLMHNPYDIQWKTSGPDKKTKIVDAKGPPGDKAYQVRVKSSQPNPWDIQIALPLDAAVKSGDKVVMHFWARTEKPVKDSDTAQFSAMIQRNAAPYDTVFNQTVTPGAEWKIHTLQGIAQADFSADEIQVAFQLGNAAQTVEFGQFYVSNLGQ